MRRIPKGPELLVALDIDGTLVAEGSFHVPQATREAVADVVAAGYRVVLASGRSLVGILPVATVLGLHGAWLVASNGAVTARMDRTMPCGYRVESCQVLDVAPVVRLARRLCPGVRVAVEEVGWGYRVSTPFGTDELNGRQTVVGPEDLVEAPTPRVVLAGRAAASRLLGPVRSLGCTANPANPDWVDVTPEGVSKATALDAVRRHLGIDETATVAIGDGVNDLQMLAWAARSFAMGHASPVVQEAAGAVTGTLAENGAATVLRSLLAAPVVVGA
ncbi:HAD family hydrolase [Antribacter gilvus]|uniref:HAD family hydrolase n=1 Tax=Antribacter gilvus TaxID=2304675 RepID=UPI000F784145|nr:HAD family hydrolase [Antribacter gilvus]